MFGRQTKEAPHYLEPTPCEREQMYSAAISRIESQEGVDYLDGFKLPPNDVELWDPRPITHVRNRVELVHNEKGKLTDVKAWDEYSTHTLSLTNAHVRESNIRAISHTGRPLYIKWEDVSLDTPERPKRFEKVRAIGTLLLERMRMGTL